MSFLSLWTPSRLAKLKIAHVRCMKILTRFRVFLVIFSIFGLVFWLLDPIGLNPLGHLKKFTQRRIPYRFGFEH